MKIFASILGLLLMTFCVIAQPAVLRTQWTTNGTAAIAAPTHDATVSGVNLANYSANAPISVRSTNHIFNPQLVANLGTPVANTYPIRYASDVITSRGTGGFVQWNGSNWRTMEDNVIATGNLTNYFINAYSSGLNTINNVSMVCSLINGLNPTYTLLPVQASSSGTGSGTAFPGVFTSYGYYNQITFGTTTSGYAQARIAVAIPTASADNTAAVGGAFSFSALSDAADVYWAVYGLLGNTSGTLPAFGSFFAYDAQKTIVSSPGSTNNWWAVCRNSSTSTEIDTGLPVSASENTPDRLFLIQRNGGTEFYTNGVFCCSITSNQPSTTSPQIAEVLMVKTAGTTSRNFEIFALYVNSRHTAFVP